MCCELDFVDSDKVDVAGFGHRFSGADPIIRSPWDAFLFARDQRDTSFPDSCGNFVVNLAREQPQGEAHHPRIVLEHSLDGAVRLTRVRRTEHGGDQSPDHFLRGALAGMLLASAVTLTLPPEFPVTTDLRVWAIAAASVLVLTLLVGLPPAFAARRLKIVDALAGRGEDSIVERGLRRALMAVLGLFGRGRNDEAEAA